MSPQDDPNTVPIQKSWFDYWQNILAGLAPGGLVGMPLRGLAYRLSGDKRFTLVLAARQSRRGRTDVVNRRLLRGLGYEVDEASDALVDTPEEFCERMESLVPAEGRVVVHDSLLERVRQIWQNLQRQT